MHENIWRRVTFLVNLLLCRLDKFDGPIFGGGGGGLGRGLIFWMLIGLHIWGAYIREAYIWGGVLTEFYAMKLKPIHAV